MKTFPAVRDPGSIELLFRNLRSTEAPEKITTDYLASVGFRRQSDVKLLELLFFLGFIDSSLAPSKLWQASYGASEGQFAALLAEAIRRAYEAVFKVFPDKENLDGKALMAYFRDETGVSDTEAAYMVLTLQVLSDIADFSEAEQVHDSSPAVPAEDDPKPAPAVQPLPDVSDEPAPTVEIPPGEGLTINITIPAEAIDGDMMRLIRELLAKLR